MKKVIILLLFVVSSSIRPKICAFSNPLLQAGVRYMFNLEDQCENQRNWFTQLIMYYCTADNAFNNDGKKVDLSESIFGGPFAVRDIYLASKLAEQGKVVTGQTPNEQYLALLAPTRVAVEAEEREFAFKFTTIYFNRVPETEKLIWAFGMVIPVVHQFHVLTGKLIGGSLLDQSAIAGPDFPAVTSLSQFYNDFQSTEDFLFRGVIAPKDLTFKQLQRKTGISDINMMALIDLHEYIEGASGVQVGLNVVLPTGRKINGEVVWGTELGQGGGFLFDPFINLVFEVDHHFINPLFFFGFRGGIPFCVTQRVPQLKNQESTIFLPPSFADATIEPFSEFDSSVLQLSDQAVSTRIRPGMGVVMRVANFFEDVFIENFRIGINYVFISQAEDFITVESPRGKTFNTALLEKNTREIQHFFVWNVSYSRNDDEFEAYLGSQHVIAGKNTSQSNKIFLSLRWQF